MAEIERGATVTMTNGRKARVIDLDLERDCAWVLVDGEQYDRKVWMREIAQGVSLTANAIRPDHPLAAGLCVHGLRLDEHCAACGVKGLPNG